jgi:hypothetical protein
MVLASPIGFLFGTYNIANGLRQSIEVVLVKGGV